MTFGSGRVIPGRSGGGHVVDPTEPVSPPDGLLWINPDESLVLGGIGSGYIPGDPIYYTASGTFTKGNYSGMVAAKIQTQAPGGGGGGSSGVNNRAGGGGGGGGYAEAIIGVTALATSETITIGAVGAAGVATANGGNGAASSFGIHVVASGGIGGFSSNNGGFGGQGGIGTVGQLLLRGDSGSPGANVASTSAGNGGASALGGGGPGGSQTGTANNGTAGGQYGGGGGGGAAVTVGANGAAGASGIVIVTPLYATTGISTQSSVGSEVVGYTEVANIALTSTTMSPIGTITLTIPATWLAWRCEAHWSVSRQLENNASAGGYIIYEVYLAGVGSQQQAVTRFMNIAANAFIMESGQGYRSDITATGDQTLSVRALVDAGTVTMQDLNFYARAVRTS